MCLCTALEQVLDPIQLVVPVQPAVPTISALDEPVKCNCFGVLDEVEVKNALAGGIQKSKRSEVWACNA